VDTGATNAADEVETAVGGRYRLLAVVGSGGMGRVWRATDELLGREVAVKEITTAAGVSASDQLAMQLQTMHEARAAARLDHPNVVGVFDVVSSPGRCWIVMEYVESRSLHDVVAQDGPLSHRDAAHVGLGVLAALRAAHAAGVLHRDVKPHNVLIAANGRVVLGDFGLATFADAEHTGSEPIMGSPHFVAPERLRSGATDAASDLWSLGATLYALVEGRPPFARETATESLSALVTEPPDPVTRPGPLNAVIAALLVKDPAQRMTAEDAEVALRRITDRAVGVSAVPQPRRPVGLARIKPPIPVSLAGRPIGIVPVEPEPAPPAVPAATSAGRRPGPSRTTRSVLAAAALALGVVGTAVALGSRGNNEPGNRTAGAAPVVAATTEPAVLLAQPCGGTPAAASPVTALPGKAPAALPAGWLWHRDTEGFQVALPQTWTRSTDGAAVCFHDPDGARTFSVQTGAPVTGRPLDVWRSEEKSVLADGTLPGYVRVDMGVVMLQKGGAQGDYTGQPGPDQRQHVRRLLLSTGGGQAYLLRWSTPDREWPLNEPHQRRIVASFRSTR
jgi:hypothetical protein